MNEYFKKMIEEYGFERRLGQEQMAGIIMENVLNLKSCIIEAGTGIGKTFAYLLPLVMYAKKYKKRVVISTNTINLQEQIINKDLPFIEKLIGCDIRYRLVKGRGNYVCGNRLMRNCTDETFINWYKSTKTGDKSEIDFYIDPTIWDQIKADKDYCINAKCRQTNNCFYYKARELVNDSEILIVNHALLFSHFKYDKILPDFDVLVFDEAHNIESVARSYFETDINSKDIGMSIGMIYNNRTNTGIIRKFSDWDEIYIDFIGSINGIYTAFSNLFNEIRLEMLRLNTISIRIDKILNFDKYETCKKALLEKFNDFESISKVLLCKNLDEDLKKEYLMYYSKIKESVDFLFENKKNDEKIVEWFSYNKYTQEVRIVKTPLDISNLLKSIYENLVVIMSSATLRIGDDFSYIEKRLGLENFNKYFVESPFDYDKNMKILLSDNRYNPNSSEYLKYVIDFLNKYLQNQNEGTFVLCTSYKQVQTLSNGVKIKGFKVLVQGQMSRTKMIEEFKNSKSILFGTDSFWEGVDVKGDSLKNIVIVKLPFLVPDNPITEALIEDIEQKGLNPFTTFQLPQAIIKLKQGVGRLIRSKNDSGNILILDNRVKTKPYGKIILSCLPSKTVQLMV